MSQIMETCHVEGSLKIPIFGSRGGRFWTFNHLSTDTKFPWKTDQQFLRKVASRQTEIRTDR